MQLVVRTIYVDYIFIEMKQNASSMRRFNTYFLNKFNLFHTYMNNTSFKWLNDTRFRLFRKNFHLTN